MLSVLHLQGASVGLTDYAEDAIDGLSVVVSIIKAFSWASIAPNCSQDEDCSRRCWSRGYSSTTPYARTNRIHVRIPGSAPRSPWV